MTDIGIIGDIFNARDISPKELSDGFIPSPEFSRLLGDSHCVLEGPRGSGKTTLLRMLTPEAYARWSTAKGESSVKFIGVFVPADIRWAKQLEIRLRNANRDTKVIIEQAAFSVAVNLSLINTLEQCSQFSHQYKESHPEIFFTLSRKEEGAIVDLCAQLWQLSVNVSSFNAIRLALRMRQHTLGQLTLSALTMNEPAELVSEHPFLGSTWLDNAVTAIESINEILDRKNQLWAILLDELEIIPEDLLKTIVGAFRSTSSLVRFKMALSPTGSRLIATGDDGAPTPGNDYRNIPLWYSDPKDAKHFSETLFRSALEKQGIELRDNDLAKFLNSSTVEDDEDDDLDVSAAAEGSMSLRARQKELAHRERVAAFVSLYKKDQSFKEILDKNGIDPSDPPYKDGAPNGTFVRKITPIAIFRDREIEKYDFENGVRRKGARRGFTPYIGYPKLIELTEGNPRWILTLVEALKAGAHGKNITIGATGVQTDAVEEFTRSFTSKLKVYPTSQSQWTAFKFISVLGDHLDHTLYNDPFMTDPSLSFTIDSWAFENYGSFIRVCIDLGALVIMRGDTSAGLASGSDGQSLLGSRVRVSYRLAPIFRLPLKATKEQAMSTALKAARLSSRREETPAQGRLSL